MSEEKRQELGRDKLEEELKAIFLSQKDDSTSSFVDDGVYELGDKGLEEEEIKTKSAEQKYTEIHDLRVGMMKKLTWFVLIWCILVIVIVLLSACFYHTFQISDQVLIALISSTPLNFFAAFLLGVKWLFKGN